MLDWDVDLGSILAQQVQEELDTDGTTDSWRMLGIVLVTWEQTRSPMLPLA